MDETQVHEIRRRRARFIRMHHPDRGGNPDVFLAGLRALDRAASSATGAAVRVRRRRARITATSAARGRAAATALTEPVTQAARSRLDSLDMRNPPRLTVHIVPRSR
jgi:hypothetical protein